MARETSALRLGAPVCFEDRWQGHVAAVDITEDWEVLNFTVASGFLFMANSVKLPVSTVTEWKHDGVYVNITSIAAFAREVPPVAAPSRPVSSDTPIAHPGAKLAGFVIGPDRKATEVLIRSGVTRRVPIGLAQFDGKSLALGTQLDTMPQYMPDEELLQRLREAIAGDPHLVSDDKLGIITWIESGTAVVGGNTRVHGVIDHIDALVRRIPGIGAIRNEAIDDITLEQNIGSALERTGVQHSAEVFARSNLGIVTLYGNSPTARTTEGIVREVVRVKGVREVRMQMELRPTGAPASIVG